MNAIGTPVVYGASICGLCNARANGARISDTMETLAAEHSAHFHRDLQVGDGVTLVYPQDRYGYVVISRTAKRAKVVELDAPSAKNGYEPERYDGPFPVWSHTYTDDELMAAVATADEDHTKTISLRGDGRWYFPGANTPVWTDQAHYYRNYSY